MITSEKTFERKLGKAVIERNGLYVKLTTEYSNIGLPDRLCIFRGFIIFAEIKSYGKKPSKIQKLMHEKLNARGFNVFIVDSEEKLKFVIDYIDNKINGQN